MTNPYRATAFGTLAISPQESSGLSAFNYSERVDNTFANLQSVISLLAGAHNFRLFLRGLALIFLFRNAKIIIAARSRPVSTYSG